MSVRDVLKRFEPTSNVARQKIDELVKAGGTVVNVARDRVEILRFSSLATVDGIGRVSWQPAPSEPVQRQPVRKRF